GPRLLRKVPGDDAVHALAPGRAAVLGEPDAAGRDGDRQPRRVARPRADGVEAHAARPRRPLGAPRVVPEPAHQLPRAAPVAAAEERRRRDPGPELPLGRPLPDDPDPLDRRALALGEHGPVALLPP